MENVLGTTGKKKERRGEERREGEGTEEGRKEEKRLFMSEI